MITDKELKLLTELSKLGIPEEKYSEYIKEMAAIISLMDTISDADCEYSAKDMSRAISFASLREDSVVNFEDMDAIIKNAPKEKENQFVVPKVVDW